jgi:hypothetical protein
MATVCRLFDKIRLSVKRDITEFVSQKRMSKYYTVKKIPIFPDAPNLFVMYAKARVQIKFLQRNIIMVPIFDFGNF